MTYILRMGNSKHGWGLAAGVTGVTLLLLFAPKNSGSESKELSPSAFHHPIQENSSSPLLAPDIHTPSAVSASIDLWTNGLIEKRTAKRSHLDRASIKDFNQQAISYVLEDGSKPSLTSLVESAEARRASLKELMKQNPQEAWDLMLSNEVRTSLPPQVQPFLEQAILQEGDWMVYSACFWEDGSSLPSTVNTPPSHFQEAVIGEERLNAFPVGLLRQGGTSKGILLNGFEIDGTAIFEGVPSGPLESGSQIPSTAVLHPKDPITGALILEETSTIANNTIPKDFLAVGTPEGIYFFESEHSREIFLAAQFQQSPPSDESSSGFLLEAPLSSVSGEPDSLPLSNRYSGDFKGGQSLSYRTLLYVRIAFANDPGQVVQTEASAYFDLRSANDHILKSSYGRMQILPTVTPIIVLPEPQSYYASQGTGALAADAKAVANSMGYTSWLYGHRVYRYNGSPGTFEGLASTGNNPGDIWMRQSSAALLVHEIGHNYSLLHSNGWVTESKAAIGPSSSVEYDHGYCLMGELNNFDKNTFNSYQKSRIGWLKDSEYVSSQVSGRHRIYALDSPVLDPDKRYAIRIPTPNRGNYWVEYRQDFTDVAFKNGLLLQAQGNGWGTTTMNPQRIDVTYWSKKDKADSHIPMGWTFSDHEQGVHITPLDRADDISWIEVQVHHEQDVTTNTSPTGTLSASTVTPAVGESVSFTLQNILDPDGDELRYYWYFDNGVYQNSSFSILTSRSFSWDSPGVYQVMVIITDMKGGTCFRSIPVTVGAPSTFSISGQILDHANQGVAGVAVDNGLGFSNTDYRSSLTDEDGTYTLGRLPTGSYTVRARKDFDVYGVRGFTNPVTIGPSNSGIGFRARVLQVASTGSPSESGGTGSFSISRVKSPSNFASDISFRISMSGDAEEGSDYSLSPAPTNGLYTMLSTADSLTLTLTATDDSEEEGPEDVTLALAMTDGLSLVSTDITKATLLIEDNESSLPRVRAIPMNRQLAENGGVADVLFIRYGDTTNPLTVNIGTDSGEGLATYGIDYTFNTGSPTLVIPAGSKTATLHVTGVDDSELEGDEKARFRINLGSGYVRDRDPSNILIDISDDELPLVSITAFDTTTGEGNNGLGAVRFTRDPVHTSALAIQYGVRGTALHGTDYAQLEGTVTIPANEASVDVVIQGLPDALIEGSETAIVRGSVAFAFNYFLDPLALEATVSVNDKPILTLTGPAGSFSELAPVAKEYTIQRVGPTDAVTVSLESLGSAEAELDFTFPESISLPANSSSVTFSVTPLTDNLPEGEETVTLSLIPKTEYGVDVSAEASRILADLPVDEWRYSTFGSDASTPAIAGDTADPDVDRLSNLYEFATLSNPQVVNTADLQPEADSNTFSLEFKRRKNAGVTVQCLWSNEPDASSGWSTIGITEEILEDTLEFTRVKASIPVSSEVLFLKVEVTRTP